MSLQQQSDAAEIGNRLLRLEMRGDFDRTLFARDLTTTRVSLEREIELLRLEITELHQSIRELSQQLQAQSAFPSSTAGIAKIGLAVAIPLLVLLLTGDPNLAAKTGKATIGAH